MAAQALGIGGCRGPPCLRTAPHDAGPLYARAPRPKTANAAGPVRRQSWVPRASNHTNPSSPYERMPANRLAILAGWPGLAALPVSAMSIGSMVSARTALIVGPNREANIQSGLR